MHYIMSYSGFQKKVSQLRLQACRYTWTYRHITYNYGVKKRKSLPVRSRHTMDKNNWRCHRASIFFVIYHTDFQVVKITHQRRRKVDYSVYSRQGLQKQTRPLWAVTNSQETGHYTQFKKCHVIGMNSSFRMIRCGPVHGSRWTKFGALVHKKFGRLLP